MGKVLHSRKNIGKNTITIVINCPASKVFAFTLDPANTPAWIPSIVREETNEAAVKIGTEYRNLNAQGVWTTYTLARLEPNRLFEMKQKNSPYHVQYTFRPIAATKTALTYFEWVDEGELEKPFSRSNLEKLKTVIEKELLKRLKAAQFDRKAYVIANELIGS